MGEGIFQNGFCGPLLPPGLLPERASLGYNATVPRIPDQILDGIAFLFRTADEAKARERMGGTGFLVGRVLEGSEKIVGHPVSMPYLVSNKHVVFDGSACVASVNRRDGLGTEVWDIDQNEWVGHPSADIVAASAVGHLNNSSQRTSFIQDTKFVSQDFMYESQIGIGDEVFMVGRFINHQGSFKNRPAARFGTLSMMPEKLVIKGVAEPQWCFAVEMRSRTGFSGSPVVAYRTRATTLVDVPGGHEDFWTLLGVNVGYVIDEDGSNTWLNGVIPAWKIQEVLDLPPLKKIHEQHEAQFAKEIGRGAVATGLVPVGYDDPEPEGLTEAEITERRDAAVRRALSTPPKPRTGN